MGLKTLSSKCPWLPAKPTPASFPITCAHTMVKASVWVGFTLPGIIEEPGSFSGSRSSPSPLLGPEARNRMSLAILNRETAVLLSALDIPTMASWLARASNLFSAVTNGSEVNSEMFLATSLSHPSIVFKPVPTAVPP